MKKKRRTRLSKAQGQQFHAQRRAMERLGMKFNRFVRKEIVAMIIGGDAELLEQQSIRVSRWKVTYEGKTFEVCYDKHRRRIITLWPPREE